MIDEKVLIWGAGAIGGILGAYWARVGLDVIMVDIVQEHVLECRANGLKIEGPVENFCQKIECFTPNELKGKYNDFKIHKFEPGRLNGLFKTGSQVS